MGFLVVGESLVDLIGREGSWTFEATPGGSPLNVAIGLAARQHPVRLASEVGADFFGGLLRDHLVGHAVDVADLAVVDTPTSLAFAHVDRGGSASYDFRFGWTFAGPVSLHGVSCLHVGSLGAAVAPGAATVRGLVDGARRAGIAVSYDPNVRPALVGPRDQAARLVEDLVGAVDVVKVSDEDLGWLYPGEPDLAVAARWAGQGPGLVVVTRGAQGAVGIHAGQLTRCAAAPVSVVDTVGAGDAFMAGLLSALAGEGTFAAGGSLQPASCERAVRQATATASAVCTRRGAAPAPAELVAELAAQVRIVSRLPLADAVRETST